jgi:hypothetical protein
MVTGLLVGAAAPAQATQVPFNFDLPIPLDVFSVRVSGHDEGSGFVGGCDVKLQCVGASARVVSTEGGADFGNARVVLRGSLCAMDQAAPCGAAGDPGTGFVFTERTLIVEGSRLEVPEFTLEFCTWERAPRFDPTSCTTVPITPADLSRVSLGSNDLSGVIPQSVLL